MGKRIVILGNSGSGKTTLTKLLCQKSPYSSFFEQHLERPFQKKFSKDFNRFAFANQMDYLLYRVEQEINISRGKEIGIQDGGLEMDFFVFTRLFYQKGYLSPEEFELCQRFYDSIRCLLPAPDLAIYLTASLETLTHRKIGRGRDLDISKVEDLRMMQTYLDEFSGQFSTPLLILDTQDNDPTFSKHLDLVLEEIAAQIA